MKVAVVYYSMSSNTEYIAKLLQDKYKCDLIKLTPKKEYPDKGFKKFFWGGKSALMKETPELEDYKFDSKKYDMVIIGSPIWAGNYTPPIRTFINEYKDKINDKQIAAFFCCSGGSTVKAFEKLKKDLGINQFESEMTFVDPSNHKEETKDKFQEFIDKIR
jgi:flavodoxin